MSKPLVIFGVSSYAEIAALYFSRQGIFEPVTFCVDDEYAVAREAFGLPVTPLSRILEDFPPEATAFHVAATYTNMNRLRHDKVVEFIRLGYAPASYISPHAFVDDTATFGQHVFIFEDNTIQPFTRIGSRVVLWSGNHVGHHSTIEDDVFVSSHVVISGHCQIGARSFLGVNCSVGNGVSVGRDNWILPGTNVLSDTGDDEMWRPQRSQKSGKRPLDGFSSSST